MNAEQNFRLLREIDDHREFILAVYRQNPQLLEHAERRIRQLFEPLPEGDSGAALKIAPKRATATHGG